MAVVYSFLCVYFSIALVLIVITWDLLVKYDISFIRNTFNSLITGVLWPWGILVIRSRIKELKGTNSSSYCDDCSLSEEDYEEIEKDLVSAQAISAPGGKIDAHILDVDKTQT